MALRKQSLVMDTDDRINETQDSSYQERVEIKKSRKGVKKSKKGKKGKKIKRYRKRRRANIYLPSSVYKDE